MTEPKHHNGPEAHVKNEWRLLPKPDPPHSSSRFELIRDGLNETTRRDLYRPRHWRGLTAIDSGLLAIWVRDHIQDVGELHTDVVCGIVPVLEGELATEANRRAIHGLHPLRIDACAWFMNEWWILECKPAAGHRAFGQVVAYGYWGSRGNERLIGCSLGIITDMAQDMIRPVCDEFGITLFEVYAQGP